MNIKPNRGHISAKQRAVIDDILKNGISESEALAKHSISLIKFRRWLKGRLFLYELNTAIDAAVRQTNLTMAYRLPLVAKTLTGLIANQKGETIRKACLDIIELQKTSACLQLPKETQDEQARSKYNLTQEKAAKIWAVLAEKNEKPASAPPSSKS
jgi:hypothetical protein